MDSTGLNSRLRVIVRGVVLAMLIGSLLLVGSSLPISADPISFWESQPVGVSESTIRSLALGDLDHDGDQDVVSGSWGDGAKRVRAWRNSGSPFAGLWFSNEVGIDLGTVRSVAVGDLDGDPYPDIVTAWSYVDEDPNTPDYKVIVWENDGAPFTGGWSSNEVGFPEGVAYSVALGDLDGDGYLDIVAGLYHNTAPSLLMHEDEKGILDLVQAPVIRVDQEVPYQVLAWKNPGPSDPFTTAWITHTVGASLGDVHTVAVGDLDQDLDLDIVTGSGWAEDYDVIAWENDGSPFDGLWEPNDVGVATSVWSVAVGDLDGDDYPDIVSGSVTQEDYEVIAWWNDGSPFDGLWYGNNVGASLDTVWSVALGHLDDDGYLDIVSGSGDGEDHEVIAWQNDGSPFNGLWGRNHVGAIAAGAWSVALGHVDDDGYLDIVSGIGWPNDYEVMVWRNIVYAVEVTPPTDAKSGNPGDPVTYTLHLTNMGNKTDTFDVAASGNAWETTVQDTVGPLAAGASQNVPVTVTIPTNAAGGSTDVATITVTSWTDDTQWDTSTLTTTANPVYGVEVTPATDAKSGNPGEMVAYTLQVTNSGNTTDTLDVTVSGYDWETTAPATVGPLAAGGSAPVEVTVTIPMDAAGGATDEATVTVTSQGDNTQWDTSTLTTTSGVYRLFFPVIMQRY